MFHKEIKETSLEPFLTVGVALMGGCVGSNVSARVPRMVL